MMRSKALVHCSVCWTQPLVAVFLWGLNNYFLFWRNVIGRNSAIAFNDL